MDCLEENRPVVYIKNKCVNIFFNLSLVFTEYDLPLAGAGSLGVHRLVESMKHAFALRMSLGDPGPNTDDPFVNVNDILNDMLSDSYALQLR